MSSLWVWDSSPILAEVVATTVEEARAELAAMNPRAAERLANVMPTRRSVSSSYGAGSVSVWFDARKPDEKTPRPAPDPV